MHDYDVLSLSIYKNNFANEIKCKYNVVDSVQSKVLENNFKMPLEVF